MIKSINITWHIEDVQQVDITLTDEQASKVLIVMKENHNAEIGINWDEIKYTIRGMKLLGEI